MSEVKTRKPRKKKEDLGITPLPKPIEVKVEENKYWIKIGMAVSHVDYPGIKMRVAEIKKYNKEIVDGSGNKKQHTFIRGVACTWLDKDHKFQKGVFNTRELQPWKN